MYRAQKQRKYIIVVLSFILIVMSGAYAAFQSNLKIKGTTRITSLWDVRITNVTAGTPTGSAENAVAPTWDKLIANMEANLYEKGDAMEYDVTITNNGTVDAILSDVIGTPSNSEAVIITFSGYAKGEKLYKKGHEGNTKVVHVKIAYNPEYDGGETSGEANVEFNFTQGEGGDIDPGGDKYLIAYNYTYNGGASSQAVDEYVESGTTITLNKTATKPGWTFVGWNTNKNATTGLASVVVSSNTTVYAIYSKTLTATYQKSENIESISKTSDTCTIYNLQTGCNKTLPTITPKPGYTSDTWYNGTEAVGHGGDTYELKNNVTLTTAENTNKYQVVYNYSENGGTSATKTQDSVDYNANIDLTPTATKAGWTFVGWNTDKDACSGLGSLKMGTADVTLYAIYRKEAVTLTAKFNANGATLSSTANKTCTLAAVCNKATQATSCTVDAPTITAPTNTPTVVGFNTSANATTNNSSYNASTGKLTLTASNDNNTWYAITKKDAVVRHITFNPNGNTSFTYSGTRQTATKTYDLCTVAASYNNNQQASTCSATITIPTIEASSNTPTLIGWSNSATNRTAAYTSGQSNVTITASSDLTYYAQTTKAKQYFMVHFSDGTGVSTISKTVDSCVLEETYNGVAQASSCAITLPTITAENGYTKDGFYNGNDRIGNDNTPIGINSDLNGKTFIAKATANIYEVTLDGGDVQQVPSKIYYQFKTTKVIDDITCYYYSDSTLTTCLSGGDSITPPSKDGYTFGGYYTGENGTGNYYIGPTGQIGNILYLTVGNKTLHAKWTANTYNINYTLNGGTNPSTNPTSGTYDSNVQISNPTKTVTITGNANGTGATIGSPTSANQTFAGWTSANLGGNAVTGDTSSPATPWNGSSTTNTYFKNLVNSGSVTMVANWTPVAVKLPTLSKTGSVCKWYTEATGGTEMGSGGDDWLPGATSNAAVTAYVRCDANEYTVKFNANDEDAVGTMADQTYTYGEEKKLTKNAFTKTGYTFKGWATSSTGNVEYDDEEEVSNLATGGTFNLYAVWRDETEPVITATNAAGSTSYLASPLTVNAANNKNTGTFSIKVGATDSGSGLSKIEYVIDQNASNPSSGWTETTNGATLSLTKEFGTYYLHIKATDNDGNISYATTKVLTVRYAITFRDYATNTSNSQILYATPDSPTITIRTPSRTGYTFLGWYTNASGSTKSFGNAEPGDTYTPTKSFITYGHWGKSVSDLTIEGPSGEFVYDGTAKTPTVVVKDGSTTLTLNTHYTVSYSDNTNAGTATLTITGKNAYYSSTRAFYTGSVNKTFTIEKSPTTTTMPNVEKTYNGSAQAASGATSILNSNESAISGGSYTYTYYNGDSCSGTALSGAPKDAGTYSVKATLTGTNNYLTSTSECATYTMAKKKATINVEDSSIDPDFGSSATNTYTYDGDGTVTCSSSDSSKVTCAVDQTNKKITVTPIAATDTPVTITVSASDGTNYSAPDDKTFTVTVGRKPVTFPTCSDKTYTAAEQTLFAAHTSGEYTNSVLKGTNVNSYTVSLTPTANYKWSSGSNVTSARTLTCEIVKSDTTTSLSAITKTYNGSNQPASGATSKLVSNNSTISGASYTYKYYTNSSCSTGETSTSPENAGTYYVKATLTGTNNYNTSTSSCVKYTMNKKVPTLALEKDAINLTPDDSDTNTYTYDGDGNVSCTSGDTSKVTCSVNTSTKKVTVTAQGVTSTPVTITVKATAGDNYSAPTNATFTVAVSDASVPIPEITTTSTLESTSQTATLKCSDDVGVVGYYWGTTAPTSSSQYTAITSTKNMSITQTINAAGTYYLSCKDSSGNISQSPASKEYNSYTINNMLQKTSGDTYTTTDYTQDSSNTYIAPNGTTITMSSVYTVPSGSNANKYKGFSVGAASTTAASVTDEPNPILSSNSTYSVWFTRNLVIFNYKPNGGTVRASTSDSSNTYAWSTDSNDLINISVSGGTAKHLSTNFRYGVNKIDIANYNNSSYLYITKSGSVAPSGAEWICESGCATANMTITQGSKTLTAPTGGVPTDAICNAKNDDCTVVVKVNWKNSAAIPTAANYCQSNLIYNGSEQTVTKAAGTGYTFSGNKGTNAGSYTVTATLASGYTWSDRTTGTKTFSCSIGKATPEITLSATSGTTNVGTNLSFNEKANVAGTFTNTSGTTANATVAPLETSEVAANTNSAVTVTPVKFGTSTITVTFVPTDTTNYNSITADSSGKKTYLARIGATASFEKNGATSIGDSSLSCYPASGETSCTVVAPTITRSGYTIVGWSTNSNATTSSIQPGDNITLTGNETYYAITKKTVTASWNANGATLSSSTASSCDLYNTASSCEVTAPTITRSGYDIIGWNTSTTATTNNSNYNTSTGKLTLSASGNYYAITRKTLTATWNANESTLSSTSPSSCYLYNTTTTCTVDAPTITAPANTPTVVGWNTSATATTNNSNYNTSTGKLTLSASGTWFAITKKDAVTLTASWNANGATLSSTADKTCTLAVTYNGAAQATSCTVDAPTITAPANTPTVLGYNTSADANANHANYNLDNGKLTLTSALNNQTWYAQTMKAATDLKATFDPNGNAGFTFGGTSYTTTTEVTICTAAATYNGAAQATSCSSVTMPTITAHANTTTLIGWSDAANNHTASYTSGQVVNTLDAGGTYYAQTSSGAAVTLTAKWNANGATLSSTANKTCTLATTYNGVAKATSCTVDAPTITREGFNIVGFNTSASATAKHANYNTSTGKLTLTSSLNNKTWYALTNKTITVTFAKGANTSAIGSTSGSCVIRNNNTSCTIATPTITSNSGYLFAGWSTTNGATTGTLPGANITVNSNATYYGNSILGTPTYVEDTEGEVVITFPSGCSSPYTCKYKIGGGSDVSVTTNTVTVNVGEDELITSTAMDGRNTASSTYTSIRHNLYVKSDGSDTTGYGTVAHPYATIARAYNAATDTRTSTIYVMDNITESNGVYMDDSKDIILTSSDTSGVSGTAINTVTRSSSYTGAFCKIDTGTLAINNLKYNGANVSSVYGAILAGSNSTVELNSGVEMYNFKSLNSGGAIDSYLDTDTYWAPTITINGAKLYSNSAPNGGAIYVASDVDLTINSNTSIYDNTSTRDGGGAIYTDSGSTVTLNGGSIYFNSASANGGAIYSNGILNLAGSQITENGATNGGAIYNKGTLNYSSGALHENTASWGGAINNTGTLNMTGGSITYNEGNAAGIFNDGTATITAGTISNNTSSTVDLPGGVFNSYIGKLTVGGTITIDNNTTNYSAHGRDLYAMNINNDGRITDSNTGYWNLNSSNSYFGVYSSSNTNFVLDVDHGTVANGTNVDIWTNGTNTNQQWRVLPHKIVNGKIYYVLAPDYPGDQTLNNYGNTSTIGTSVKTWEWTTGINGSLWSIENAGSGYWYIKSYTGNMCLDIAGGTMANGTDVDVWTCTSQAHQKWAFSFVREYRTDTGQWYNYRYTQ